MRIVNVPKYVCEVCNTSFTDRRAAQEHEDACRREAFIRSELLGRWVALNGRVQGIACMSRAHDVKVGVMDPLQGSVGWYTPSSLQAVPEDDGREYLEDTVGSNIDQAMERARGYVDEGNRVPPMSSHPRVRVPVPGHLRLPLRDCRGGTQDGGPHSGGSR